MDVQGNLAMDLCFATAYDHPISMVTHDEIFVCTFS